MARLGGHVSCSWRSWGGWGCLLCVPCVGTLRGPPYTATCTSAWVTAQTAPVGWLSKESHGCGCVPTPQDCRSHGCVSDRVRAAGHTPSNMSPGFSHIACGLPIALALQDLRCPPAYSKGPHRCWAFTRDARAPQTQGPTSNTHRRPETQAGLRRERPLALPWIPAPRKGGAVCYQEPPGRPQTTALTPWPSSPLPQGLVQPEEAVTGRPAAQLTPEGPGDHRMPIKACLSHHSAQHSNQPRGGAPSPGRPDGGD